MSTQQQTLSQSAAEARRAYYREYYHLNKEKVLKKRKERREANHAEMLEKERAYRAANPEKVRKWQERHWTKRALEAQAATSKKRK